MVKSQTIIKHRLIMLFVLAIASIIFTGCDKGSLGIKTGAIQGYILDHDTNQPISEVFVKASGGLDEAENKSTYSSGDGSFIFGDVNKGKWTLTVEKYGYTSAIEDNSEIEVNCTIANGETIVLSPIKLAKVASGTKGILKGYPIDAITGRALTNFTINQNTPYNQRKTKTFDSAATFRDTGWTGLEGGLHEYIITANNYKPFSTNSIESFNEGVNIGKSVADLGTIQMEPLTVDISGTFRNVPGYAMGENKSIVVWAEAAGKVVASYTELDAESSKGTITYVLSGVPVTAGSVCVKCKVKGYDVITINPAVSITTANPGGVIAGVDVDFGVQEPIVADLRVIVTGTKDEPPDSPSTFRNNEVARVYVRSGGKDVVPYVDVTSNNYGGEVTIANVITGYPITVIAVNQDRKFCYKSADEFTIHEGTDIYPVTITLEEQ